VEPFFVAFLGVTLNKLLLKLKKCWFLFHLSP
jgi:hypothetical protein